MAKYLLAALVGSAAAEFSAAFLESEERIKYHASARSDFRVNNGRVRVKESSLATGSFERAQAYKRSHIDETVWQNLDFFSIWDPRKFELFFLSIKNLFFGTKTKKSALSVDLCNALLLCCACEI